MKEKEVKGLIFNHLLKSKIQDLKQANKNHNNNKHLNNNSKENSQFNSNIITKEEIHQERKRGREIRIRTRKRIEKTQFV